MWKPVEKCCEQPELRSIARNEMGAGGSRHVVVGLVVVDIDGTDHYLIGKRADGGLAHHDLALPHELNMRHLEGNWKTTRRYLTGSNKIVTTITAPYYQR